MKKLLLSIFLIISIIFKINSQNISELGKSDLNILNNYEYDYIDISLDTIDDGTKFLKIENDIKYIYYFFNTDNKCFCIVVCFLKSDNDIKDYTKTLNKELKYKNKIWSNKTVDSFVKLKDIGLELPVFFMWSNKISIPENWDYYK